MLTRRLNRRFVATTMVLGMAASSALLVAPGPDLAHKPSAAVRAAPGEHVHRPRARAQVNIEVRERLAGVRPRVVELRPESLRVSEAVDKTQLAYIDTISPQPPYYVGDTITIVFFTQGYPGPISAYGSSNPSVANVTAAVWGNPTGTVTIVCLAPGSARIGWFWGCGVCGVGDTFQVTVFASQAPVTLTTDVNMNMPVTCQRFTIAASGGTGSFSFAMSGPAPIPPDATSNSVPLARIRQGALQ